MRKIHPTLHLQKQQKMRLMHQQNRILGTLKKHLQLAIKLTYNKQHLKKLALFYEQVIEKQKLLQKPPLLNSSIFKVEIANISYLKSKCYRFLRKNNLLTEQT